MTDTLAIVRSLGALLTLLGCLAGALWAVRRFNLVLPGAGPSANRRLAVIERLNLDPRRSLALLRSDDMEHLVLMAPEGHLIIQSRIARAATVAGTDAAAAGDGPAGSGPALSAPPGSAVMPFLSRLGSDFGKMVDRARQPLADDGHQPPSRISATNHGPKPAQMPGCLPGQTPVRKPARHRAARRAKPHA